MPWCKGWVRSGTYTVTSRVLKRSFFNYTSLTIMGFPLLRESLAWREETLSNPTSETAKDKPHSSSPKISARSNLYIKPSRFIDNAGHCLEQIPPTPQNKPKSYAKTDEDGPDKSINPFIHNSPRLIPITVSAW